MKLIGGDSGRYEREELVESVLLSPSERAIVDVLFGQSGAAVLEHRTPDASSTLATFNVADGDPSRPSSTPSACYAPIRSSKPNTPGSPLTSTGHPRPFSSSERWTWDMSGKGMGSPT